MKIIKIDGFKGLITAAFMVVCLFSGFVICPGYFAMYLWNRYLTTAYMFPQLTLFQGILLWAIIALSYAILTKDGFAVSFKSSPDFKDEELESIIKTAKINSQLRMMNKIISNSDSFERMKENPYDTENTELNKKSSSDINNGDDKISDAK